MNIVMKLLSTISKRIISLSSEIEDTKDIDVRKFLETELQVWKMVKDKLEWDILPEKEKQASRIKTLNIFRNATNNIQNTKKQKAYIYIYELLQITIPYIIVLEVIIDTSLRKYCEDLLDNIDNSQNKLIFRKYICRTSIYDAFRDYNKHKNELSFSYKESSEKIDFLYNELLKTLEFFEEM